jgi:hypothetical protein
MKWLAWGIRNLPKYAAVIVSLVIILTQILNSIYIYYFSPSTFRIPNIFHAPIAPIPFDAGWIGFAFIFLNGFFLSYVLIRDGVDFTERLLLSIGLGFGVTYAAMILIGMLWEISLSTIILTQTILFITLLIAAFYRGFKPNFINYLKPKTKKVHIPKLNLFEAILLIVIGIFVVVAIYQTVAYPSIEWDSLAYGVNYAKIIFEDGKIPLIAGPSIGLEMSANYPPGVQLLAVDLYVFAGNAGDFYFRILQPIFGLAAILLTYKFAMAVTKSRTAAIFAMFALSSMSTFWELFVHETYLMCLTLMLTLAAFFFFKAYNSNNADARKFEIAGTLFCGFSALTSYIGLFSLGLLSLYSINRKISAKRFTWLVILGFAIVLPWYMRNFILLGNPLYPFFGIGNYLDPLLLSSVMGHFQNWAQVPFFYSFKIISIMGAAILFLAIAYFTVTKQKHFYLILPFYLFFVGLVIMGVHIPFVRYLIIALPSLVILLAASAKSLRPAHTLVERATAIILISLVLISSVLVLPSINFLKPTPTSGDDKWSYLSQVFEEGDAWQWINQNTPADAKIATYDIKQYYLEREIFTLDGSEAAPLYKMNTIEESIDFLEKSNVTYVLSVPWATPSDIRMPPAYKWCVLTRYLGDPRYLPPVYVGLNGTAVYHVGPLDEETVYAAFAQKNLVPPMKHVTVNLTITNSTNPPSGRFYIPIPVDYREGLMMASVNSSKHLVSAELWTGTIPETVARPSPPFELWKQWPIPSANSSGVEDPSFVWGPIYKWAYFTFLILDQEETFTESFNVTVDIRFYNYWDIKSLFVSEGSQSYNITTFNEPFPLLKTLYVQANETSRLSIYSTSGDKKISLEVFSDFLPNNAATNWSAQYDTVALQPNLADGSGEVNPSFQNLLLPVGQYSIIVMYRDSYTEQVDISLEVDLTSWSGS